MEAGPGSSHNRSRNYNVTGTNKNIDYVAPFGLKFHLTVII